VTGVKNGECPSCPIPRKSLGDGQDYNYHDLNAVLAALDSFEVSDPHSYANSGRDAGVKPIHHPFWQDLPYLHIFRSIMPDILH
jgi:Plavaka transposase